MLVGLFVIASGITLLQVAANPLSAVLGLPERSHFCRVLSQALNSFGTVIGPYLAAQTLLRGGLFDGRPVTEEKIAYSLGRIDVAYFSIAAAISVLALFLWSARARITAAAPPTEARARIGGAFSSPWAVAGAAATFLYVGAEVAIGSALVNLFEQPDVLAVSAVQIVDSQYKVTPDGLSGNDDLGQMSAWFGWTALGFYPVAPDSLEYVIVRPFVNRAALNLPNGKRFTIVAEGLSDANPNVGSVLLNGRSLDRSYRRHDEVAAGGDFRSRMQATPNRSWATARSARPFSTSTAGAKR